MTVEAPSVGKARESFHVFQHPGGEGYEDWPRPLVRALGRREAERLAKKAASGDWIIEADGRGVIRKSMPMPVYGKNLDSEARLDWLNTGTTAQRSFSVNHDGQQYVTTVDGQTVFRDSEFHPFYISWSARRSSGGDFGGFEFGL